ncbi:preprotein translocase subunit SecE [Candidatus Gracilibacteria bacterium]|nr:preprotein translocase subunit SecE [Candidatus Gracilibacteria bacterium]
MKKFLHERIGELHNVTWPTQKQAIHSVILVLIIMLITGVFLGIIDFMLNKGVLLMITK